MALVGTGILVGCATTPPDNTRQGRSGGPPPMSQAGPRGGGPTEAMLKVCEAKSSGESCTAEGTSGTCMAPRPELPLACVPEGGGSGGRLNGGRGGGPGVGGPPGGSGGASNSGVPIAETQAYTLGVMCDYSVDGFNSQLQLPSQATWSCRKGQRLLSANSVPMHRTGPFPNENNPNKIAPQTVSYSVTTTPIASSGSGGRVKEPAIALNGVKFDPGTGGRCEDSITDPTQCDLGRGTGRWTIEALGQDVFDFGEDENNAHVQPSGHYHYHGVPVGMLTEAASRGEEMQLIAWAADGFPIYARFGYDHPMTFTSGLRLMQSSYRLKATPDPGRPSEDIVPMGAFTADWEYVDGLGDLDECNGRFGATPEFPEGIYHYFATDTFPYVQRCVKGSIENSPRAGERGAGQQGQERRRGGRGSRDGNRPPRGGGRQ